MKKWGLNNFEVMKQCSHKATTNQMLIGVKTRLTLDSNVKVNLQYGKHFSAGRQCPEEGVDNTV